MNHFARFGLEPAPWIDGEVLKERFLELSASAHPDKAHASEKASSEKGFQELNQSYSVLRNTRSRLLHLLELHGMTKQEHVQNVPAAATELFPPVAAATKRADAFIKEKAAASSPMLKVRLMERGMDEIQALQDLQGLICQGIQEIEGLVKRLNDEWSPAPSADVLKRVQEAAATLGFLERWNGQLQERIGALTF